MLDPEAKRNLEELALAREVSCGSERAWREFVEQYSRLVYSVISRVIFSKEDVQTVYVSTLEHLYKDKLASFEGRSVLSTWLILVARNKALDFLRSQRGRRRTPAGLKTLSEFDREVFRLYFLEGLDLTAVRVRIHEQFGHGSVDEIVNSLQRVDSRIDKRVLRRIAYDHHAEMMGVGSGRMLEYMEATRSELEERAERLNPEFRLMLEELEIMIGKVKKVVRRLPQEERKVIRLRFEERRSARQIAEELGIDGERRVFTILQRALRRLRALLEGDSLGQDVDALREP